MSRTRSIAIVQPYVPEYRVPLFAKMSVLLRDQGLDFTVASGEPWGDQALRLDVSGAEAWRIPVRQRRLGVRGRYLVHKDLSDLLRYRRPHYVIVEQALRNLETYQLLARTVFKDLKIGVWGHGKTYTESRGLLHEGLKFWMTQKASWFFAYTQDGADLVIDSGFSSQRVTALWNSNDTDQLRTDMENVGHEDLAEFRKKWGLTDGLTALFLGGVDRRKRVDFLVEAAIAVERRLPGFVLLFGGTGAQASYIAGHEARGAPVRCLGKVNGLNKAVALRASNILMVPAWVGLVAADSLAAGVPIVTMHSVRHAPEFGYLEPNRNALITEPSDRDYVESVIALLSDPLRLKRLSQQARADGANLSINGMAERFVEGITNWIAVTA